MAQTEKTEPDAETKARAEATIAAARAKKAKADTLEVRAEQNAMIDGVFLPYSTVKNLPDSAELRAALGAGVLSLVGDDAADE